MIMVLSLVLTPAALASTWYVNGVSGSNSNNCLSPTTACKTIKHAISLASSADTIIVAPATYTENLNIGISLKILGSGASTTIIDGGGINTETTVVTISNTSAHVSLSNLTIRNGFAINSSGGILNEGILIINKSTISGNSARGAPGFGAGILNRGTVRLNNSTVTGNTVSGVFGAGFGGGIGNRSTVTVNNSTLSGNRASARGGGIDNEGNLTINNSTLSGNSGFLTGASGGAIYNDGKLSINSSTISGNSAPSGGDIYNSPGFAMTLQNSIVANSLSGGNCSGTITSKGYNLSSDSTCNFNNTGDLNNTDPHLGPLQNNGGPTMTMAPLLLLGSPAIDAGNPTRCTDGQGNLLKTDQRGMPRPNPEDTGGCDMGAFEEQGDNCIPFGGECFGPGPNRCCPAPFPHHSFCSNPTGFGTCIES
jgi:hypothetical protein